MEGTEHIDKLISLILSFFLPIAISYVKGNRWPHQAKFATAIAISIFVALLTSLTASSFIYNETMTLDDWAANALVVFTGATSAYQLYFKDRPIEQKAENSGPFSN